MVSNCCFITLSGFVVGTDVFANEWLHTLKHEDVLKKQGAVFDILDIITSAELSKFSFESIIRKSVNM